MFLQLILIAMLADLIDAIKEIVFPLFVVVSLAAGAGAAKAVKDTLDHHYAQSVFAGLKHQQFWNPAVSWTNKYRNYPSDKSERYPLSTTWLAWTTDAWHLFDSLANLLIMAAALYAGFTAGCLQSVGALITLSLSAFLARAAMFHLLYTYILV